MTKVNITGWALDSYMDLKSKRVFTDEEYWETLRTDVELLKHGFPPRSPKFSSNKFWGPVTGRGGDKVKDAFKMKWHNIGNGRVQLRLLVAWVHKEYWLCDAYVKNSEAIDKRFAARMKIRMSSLNKLDVVHRGNL